MHLCTHPPPGTVAKIYTIHRRVHPFTWYVYIQSLYEKSYKWSAQGTNGQEACINKQEPKPITVSSTFPSSPASAVSAGAESRRPATGSPSCSCQPLVLAGQWDFRWCPLPSTSCWFGSWDICTPGLSCGSTRSCLPVSPARPCTYRLKGCWRWTWPSWPPSPCLRRSLGQLKERARKRDHQVTEMNWWWIFWTLFRVMES